MTTKREGVGGGSECIPRTHLDAFLVTLPDLSAFLLVFLSLLLLVFLRVLVLLALLMWGEGRLQIPREPSIETRIICVLQGSAL